MITDMKDNQIPVLVGSYINGDTLHTHGMCGKPQYVAHVSKSRVYYIDPRDMDQLTSKTDLLGLPYMQRRSVKFMSTTLDEAKSLFKLSQERTSAVEAEVKDAVRKVTGLYQERMRAMVKASQES